MAIKREIPEVNAGSMADIAFLLLIFFLVTASIETDVGLNRILPSDDNPQTAEIKKRNLFEITINGADELMVQGKIMKLSQLRENVVAFIDNGGADEGLLKCSYCTGRGLDGLSEHPTKAIVSLESHRNTSYPVYVSVQNEIVGAYNSLRNKMGLQLFGVSYEQMKTEYKDEQIGTSDKTKLKERIEKIQTLYPQKILEVEIRNR